MFNVKWLKFYTLILIISFIGVITLSYLKPSFDNIHAFFYVFFLLTAPSVTVLFVIKNDFKRFTDTVHSLLNQIDDGIIIKDVKGKYTYCNEVVAKFYGTTTKEIIGKDEYYFSNNKEQANLINESLKTALSTFEKQKTFQSSTDITTGETRYINTIKIPFKNPRSEKYVFILAKDITEITNLKEATEKNRSRLEKILEASEECIWEWNAKTNKTNFNHQWERITGIVESDNAYEDFERAILPEDKSLYDQATETMLKENAPFNIEFRMKRPDGKVIWVWDRGRVAEYDQDGKPLWVVGITMDITASKQALTKIENLAYYDQLTGLANRTTLENELKEVSGRNEPNTAYSGLLFIDLDRFKLLNDGYSHYMGDMLLKTIADRLINAFEKYIVTRFGGDEFAILLPNIHTEHKSAVQITQETGNNVIAEISKIVHLKSDIQDLEIQYAITASAGGIVFSANDVTSSEALQLVDMALYRAKAAGGDTAIVFDINMQKGLRKTNDLSLAMHNSVINRDFCIYLQPKQNKHEELVGAEALVRWNHPTLGVLAPSEFLELAEESNAILPIGNLVLEKSCAQLKSWQSKEETKHLQLSVNLSAKQIWQGSFCQDIIKIVEAYEIDPSKLILEVTESMLIQDVNDATEKLAQLRQYGMHISLDDFGTGYSSLNYLRSLPIDELKIDRSFISDLADNEQARVMVKSIIDLATSFNLKIVSEGVETREQIEVLRQLGTTLYQGYYFSEPVPVEEFHNKYFQQTYA